MTLVEPTFGMFSEIGLGQSCSAPDVHSLFVQARVLRGKTLAARLVEPRGRSASLASLASLPVDTPE
jgi:hypothetical protein